MVPVPQNLPLSEMKQRTKSAQSLAECLFITHTPTTTCPCALVPSLQCKQPQCKMWINDPLTEDKTKLMLSVTVSPSSQQTCCSIRRRVNRHDMSKSKAISALRYVTSLSYTASSTELCYEKKLES